MTELGNVGRINIISLPTLTSTARDKALGNAELLPEPKHTLDQSSRIRNAQSPSAHHQPAYTQSTLATGGPPTGPAQCPTIGQPLKPTTEVSLRQKPQTTATTQKISISLLSVQMVTRTNWGQRTVFLSQFFWRSVAVDGQGIVWALSTVFCLAYKHSISDDTVIKSRALLSALL